jgi:hypothetical protein
MTHFNYVTEKLNSKKFKKNKIYSSKEISAIIGTTNSRESRAGVLRDALDKHPEWIKQSSRWYIYAGPQQPNLFNQPKVQPKPKVQNKPKRREISLFWGLISIK